MLKDGLVFRKTMVRWAVRSLDVILGRVYPRTYVDLPISPKKILLSHLGSLGDVIMTARLLPALRERYPLATFGFLSSPLSAPIVPYLPHVTHFHSVHHIYQGKASLGLCKAALHHRSTYRQAMEEIRAQAYDMAIDFQPFFPNAVPLFFELGIPVRIGYGSAGFAPLLTHPFSWNRLDRYLKDLHVQHLRELGIDLREQSLELPVPVMELPGKFIAVHMCSSRIEKDWPRELWIELIQRLQKKGHEVMLTGRGEKDQRECDAVMAQTGCKSFCNRLSFLEWAALLKQAALLISVDSAAVHLADLYGTPTVVLFSEANNPLLWTPQGAHLIPFQSGCPREALDRFSIPKSCALS